MYMTAMEHTQSNIFCNLYDMPNCWTNHTQAGMYSLITPLLSVWIRHACKHFCLLYCLDCHFTHREWARHKVPFVVWSNFQFTEHGWDRHDVSVSPICCEAYIAYCILRKWDTLISHLSLNREGRWGTTDDFATSFLHFSLFSIALWDLANSRPVHSLMLSSHLFLCLPYLLLPFTVPCKMVLARPDERDTWPYYCSLRLLTVVRSSCSLNTCWILASWHGLPRW